MPEQIKSINEYLYEKGRDIFVLKLTHPDEFAAGNDTLPEPVFNYRKRVIRTHQKLATDWLDRHGVSWAMTVPDWLMEGWIGHIYVDFNGRDDPRLLAWSDEFEIDGIQPRYPEKFAMYVFSHQDWVESGGLERHEALLRDMEDPDWSP